MSSHSTLDLREFLLFVKSKGASAVVEIDKPVSTRFVTTAIVKSLAQKLRTPVIQFNHIEDSSYPMVTNVCASLERIAQSAKITSGELHDRMLGALEAGISPAILETEEAPVRQVIKEKNDFSLQELPAVFYTETQTNPYLTSAILVARDPDTGRHNLSFNRLMIADDHVCAIYMTPGGHLDQIWKRNSSSGRKTPVAAVIGNHPLWCYGALVAADLGHEDYEVLSGLLNAPIALTPCQNDTELYVPAYAEIVLEGAIDPMDQLSEGPFGEFLGFVAEKAPRPTIRFDRLTHRDKPIYQDIVAGQAEHATMSGVSLRARLKRDYMQGIPAVIDFWLPAPMIIFLSIDDSQTDFDVSTFMQELLLKESYLKQVIAFDSSVDLRKQASVQMALACFMQPHRDITIINDLDGNGVDPSEISGTTSKLAIDARARIHLQTNTLPSEVE
ncbi:MAG: UbiD family decarboxylase domain-containing protein [Pseudomonadota bacterium]